MTESRQPWVDEVLAYWFGELTPAQWFFERSDAVDADMRRRFLALHEQIAGETAVPPAADMPEARALLARILLLDQLPRNMFRGTPRAFSTDRQALALAHRAVEAGVERTMERQQRLFVYLPFEHSEDAADQVTSVRLFDQLGDPQWTRYALRHKEIIDRFGRFPHRNAVLGRASTAEELAFLQEPDSAF